MLPWFGFRVYASALLHRACFIVVQVAGRSGFIVVAIN